MACPLYNVLIYLKATEGRRLKAAFLRDVYLFRVIGKIKRTNVHPDAGRLCTEKAIAEA